MIFRNIIPHLCSTAAFAVYLHTVSLIFDKIACSASQSALISHNVQNRQRTAHCLDNDLLLLPPQAQHPGPRPLPTVLRTACLFTVTTPSLPLRRPQDLMPEVLRPLLLPVHERTDPQSHALLSPAHAPYQPRRSPTPPTSLTPADPAAAGRHSSYPP